MLNSVESILKYINKLEDKVKRLEDHIAKLTCCCSGCECNNAQVKAELYFKEQKMFNEDEL